MHVWHFFAGLVPSRRSNPSVVAFVIACTASRPCAVTGIAEANCACRRASGCSDPCPPSCSLRGDVGPLRVAVRPGRGCVERDVRVVPTGEHEHALPSAVARSRVGHRPRPPCRSTTALPVGSVRAWRRRATPPCRRPLEPPITLRWRSIPKRPQMSSTSASRANNVPANDAGSGRQDASKSNQLAPPPATGIGPRGSAPRTGGGIDRRGDRCQVGLGGPRPWSMTRSLPASTRPSRRKASSTIAPEQVPGDALHRAPRRRTRGCRSSRRRRRPSGAAGAPPGGAPAGPGGVVQWARAARRRAGSSVQAAVSQSSNAESPYASGPPNCRMLW